MFSHSHFKPKRGACLHSQRTRYQHGISPHTESFESTVCLSSDHFPTFPQTKANRDCRKEWQRRENSCRFHRGQKGSKNALKGSSNINQHIRQQIYDCKDSEQILPIIQSNLKEIEEISIFGFAMKKCIYLRRYHNVHPIMSLLLKSDVKPDTASFAIAMDAAAKGDDPIKCIQYLQCMMREHNLTPNKIIIGTAIKSFIKRGDYKPAEKCWNLMNELEIEPDDTCYSQMISVYSKGRHQSKADCLFTEYLNAVKLKKVPAAISVFGSYLSVISRCGNTDRIPNLLSLIKEHGLELNAIMITQIMGTYYCARKYRECLMVLDQWTKSKGNGGNQKVMKMGKYNDIDTTSKGNVPTEGMMQYKCTSMAHRIREVECYEERQRLYRELKYVVLVEYAEIGIPIDQKRAHPLLDGAIFTFRFEDPMRIVVEFEEMERLKLIGYTVNDKHKDGAVVLDLHLFQLWQSQFLIRYLIGFKAKELMDYALREGVVIIVGVGNHSGTRHREGSMRQFIVNELQSWDPPIECTPHKSNKGMICIEPSQLKPYSENDMNYAKRKLTVPSNDWYYEDPLAEQLDHTVL